MPGSHAGAADSDAFEISKIEKHGTGGCVGVMAEETHDFDISSDYGGEDAAIPMIDVKKEEE